MKARKGFYCLKSGGVRWKKWKRESLALVLKPKE